MAVQNQTLGLCRPEQDVTGPRFQAVGPSVKVGFSQFIFPTAGCLPVSLYRKRHKYNTMNLIHNEQLRPREGGSAREDPATGEALPGANV